MNGTVAYLVTGVGCLVAVAGVVIAVIALRTARRRTAPTGGGPGVVRDPFRQPDDDADALRGDPRRVQPGDIVEIRHTSYGVRGTLRFAEGSWGWTEHLLDDAHGAKVWLSVEEDPDLELVLWTEVPSATVLPGPPSIDFDGRRYASKESGRARYTSVGSTGLDPAGDMRYHDYAAPDGARLSFESYGTSERWEVGRGEKLHRTEVQIYPAATPGQAG
ncbi:DUF4178 domain-containing protein [Solwaraspora sp. WMMD1047]|uniref:DUF4178 domain-containing protein n=1 Tax=Solwaraspora sp. WMMD1047 TaxID=3016102 RepID=UPI002416B274|nr:DUF4178 domain-containing protein [Solwaraspora sp. WMMD1047]MDG4834565.1 DUF4178 domain-containing protein [Solwaraspora sp. WMMD1047]